MKAQAPYISDKPIAFYAEHEDFGIQFLSQWPTEKLLKYDWRPLFESPVRSTTDKPFAYYVMINGFCLISEPDYKDKNYREDLEWKPLYKARYF
jgi:hypothetical protein